MSTATLAPARIPADLQTGMAWWNAMTPAERLRWLQEARRVYGRDPAAADAWRLFRGGHRLAE